MAETKKPGYDDPYRMLANNLVVTSTEEELYAFLHQAKAARRRIMKEVRNTDFCGPFLDCLMVGVIKTNKQGELTKSLAATSDFFYRQLDLDRLRREIRLCCARYGRKTVDF